MISLPVRKEIMNNNCPKAKWKYREEKELHVSTLIDFSLLSVFKTQLTNRDASRNS